MNARHLTDGIGCQRHKRENVNSDTIKANLKTAEATGLPIYISEYDIGESNDPTQLATYKEQFPVFWNDLQVKGITLWGYIQVQMWRTNEYLAPPDGTERPALPWLREYVFPQREK